MNTLTRFLVSLTLISVGTVTASPVSAQAPANAPLACDWTIRASSPIGMVEHGDNATFMAVGPAIIIMLTGRPGSGGGSITVQGITGPGVYHVGGAGSSGSFAVVTVQDQNGSTVALTSGDGSQAKYQGKVIGTLPPPARLTVNHWSSSELRADIVGTFFSSDGYSQVPPRIDLVPVHISITAAPVVPSIRARPCS